MPSTPLSTLLSGFLVGSLALSPALASGEHGGLSFEQLAALTRVTSVAIAPDGGVVAYTLSRPRIPGQGDDGPAWVELRVVGADGTDHGYVTGEVNVSRVAFSPDGRHLTYLVKRGDDEHTSLWSIPLAGGESRRFLAFDTAIDAYEIAPGGKQVAFVAKQPVDEQREKAKKKGYSQEVYEEDWRPRRAYVAPVALDPPPPANPDDEPEEDEDPREIDAEGSVFELAWLPDGERLAMAIAPRPLIDDRYMLRRIHIVGVETGESSAVIENAGKLGDFVVSPDGAHVALISAADPNDPKEGRLLVASTVDGSLRDVLPGLEGHVTRVGWQDARTVMYIAAMGVETELAEIDVDGGEHKVLARSGLAGVPLLTHLSLSDDGRSAALVGQSPRHPAELFTMNHGDRAVRRHTDSNPWLSEVTLATQEVHGWTARDGLELEGILIRPLPETTPKKGSPLLMIVHGGPESHVSNGWVTSYSRPGQLAAARGYAVFYPNYRGSTGRGVAFSKSSQGDAAGSEFNDLVDAVEALVKEGIARRNRVGITGGSYGGYATAWCSTRFSEHFRAGVMFVGISNKVSKGLTTEIPVEDRMVHTLFDPWTKWQFSLERSPIFHAEKARTSLLIAGGTADTRVHPSQSLQLYRALKLIGKAPVRYVRYPGEGHGNRRAASRDDYVRRLLRWMDHFVVNGATELPPWDLKLGHEDDEEEDQEEDGEAD